jgi:outer membrane protein OmpA-like peptidoglycan-associated protein
MPIFALLKTMITVRKLNLLTVACILLLAIVSVQKVNAQDFTLSNNLLYDATLTPNLRMGVRLSEQWSLGLTAGYRPWPTDDNESKKLKHLLLAPDVRYWTDSVNVHHFFGFNLIYSHYNVAEVKFPFGLWKSVRDERRQGDLGAIGAYYGYSWPLGRFWNLEAHIGAAIGYTKFDRYECGHCGKKLGNEKKVFFLPQAGVSIVYNIPGRPRKVEEPEMLPAVETPATPAIQTFVPALSPVPEFKGRAGLLQQDNAVVAHISEYRPYDRTRILRKEKGALFVHFDLGQSLLRSDYRENRIILDRIVEITRQIVADTTSSVKKIQLVGLASIEGNPATNERLAQNRALSLQHYIQQEVSVPDSLFETVGGGEAWADFRDQLNDIVKEGSENHIGLEKVIEIIDQEQDVKIREHRIKQLDQGRTWAYLKEHILKDQRNSGYIRIYYDYVPDKAAAIINEASELLTTDCSDCHHEALRLLLTVRNDERAQNALGVAYWLCGQRDEALECFRSAAANGNTNAKENLHQLEEAVQK